MIRFEMVCEMIRPDGSRVRVGSFPIPSTSRLRAVLAQWADQVAARLVDLRPLFRTIPLG